MGRSSFTDLAVAALIFLLLLLPLVAPEPSAWKVWPPLAKKLRVVRLPWVLRAVERFKRRRRVRLAYLWLIAGAFVSALLVMVIWIGPLLLTQRPPVETALERHRAMADVRTGLTAALVAMGAGGSLAYTARTYRLTRTGQVTDRYTRAVSQLGDDRIESRLGGIYALERLMRDSPEDAPTVIEVLAAFVRERAPAPVPAPGVGHQGGARPAADVQAAVSVLGRREQSSGDHLRVDLRKTDLRGAELRLLRLDRADLTGALLQEADLTGVHLKQAQLVEANLDGANLTNAQMENVNLHKASLEGAILQGAQFPLAVLTEARLERAFLPRANFHQAWMDGADLGRTEMLGAKFQEANLHKVSFVGAPLVVADFGQANLSDADFSGVDLRGSRFFGATFTGTVLEGARVYRGSLSAEQLEEAKTPSDRITWE